jgi:hypothetical protein
VSEGSEWEWEERAWILYDLMALECEGDERNCSAVVVDVAVMHRS